MTADQLPLALFEWARQNGYAEHDWRDAETIEGTCYLAEEDVWMVGDTRLHPILLELPDATNSRYYVGVFDSPLEQRPVAYWFVVPT
jgi:hypothetical protein